MADYNIPLDIQKEIIKRLPIKSLVRFTSISKPWKSFIHSSKFIAAYQQTQRFLVGYHDYLYYQVQNVHIKYVSIVDNDTYPERELSHIVPVSVNYKTLVGSSQGLFCFLNYNYYSDKSWKKTAVIWNPTIRKSVYIVVPNVLNTYPDDTIVGFGVCPLTCDPKLVKIIDFWSAHESQSKSNIPWLVEVFTLSSGVWKSLSTNLPRKSLSFIGNQVDTDGFIYWHVVDILYRDGELKKNYISMIMSFDKTSDEFTEINLPGNLTNYREISLTISKLRDSVVVLERKKAGYGVWMMENGNPKSFTQLYTIDSPDGSYIKQVLGFSKSGKPIIVMMKEPFDAESLSVYEPNTKDINNIGIPGNPNIRFAISYMETLLLLNHRE